MGGKSDPPEVPDYTATAVQQGEANKAAAAAQNFANRPTQITPWGRVDWNAAPGVDPATGETVTQWTQEQSLDPTLQGSLEGQIGLGGERTGLAQDIFGQVRDNLGAPLDYDQFRGITDVGAPSGIRDRAEDAAYGRATGRLDPRMEQAEEQLLVRLRNQGLRPGDQAYDAEMANFGRMKNDAYASARQDATSQGRAEASQEFGQQQTQQAQTAMLRQNEIAEALGRRGMPLEEVNQLLAGQGVQPPTAPNVPYAAAARAPNLMGAASSTYQGNIDRYNAQQQQQQGLMGGLGNLAGLGIQAYGAGMFSDRRLKTNIRRLGTWRGYPFYAFDYVWGEPGLGVMADEVNPEAVSTHESGFAMVDYGKVR